jgi:hypothetical protein
LVANYGSGAPGTFLNEFGAAVSGGEVSISVPGRTNVWFFQVDPDHVVRAVGTTPFLDNTAFIFELGPFCAAVTGQVRDAISIQPITGAQVVTDGGFASPTDATGRFALVDAAGATCIPEGAHVLTASADRHRSENQTIIVPGAGTLDTVIELQCTVVEGVVVESINGNDQPVPSIEVTLTYPDGSGVVTTTDPVTGRFRFVCVRHVRATVVTDLTTPQDVGNGNPVPDTGVDNIIIRIVRACPTISGTVTDATTSAPIAGVRVAVQNTTPPGILSANTDADGRYSIPNVCLDRNRAWPLKASVAGYVSEIKSTGILPATGTVTIDFALRPLLRVWNTGVDSNGAKLAPSASDPHWRLVSGPGVTAPRAPVVVTEQHPLGQYFETTDSMWIGQSAAGSGDVGSPYTFRLPFDLTGYDVASVRIGGAWGVDNEGEMTLNGQVPAGTGPFSLTGTVTDHFNVRHGFTITGGFVAGMNALEMHATNTGGPFGLNVTGLTISATPA